MPRERDFALYPFAAEDASALTPGSFMGFVPQNPFVELIWKVRRWNLYGTLIRVPFSGPTVTEIDNPLGPGYILSGENTFPGTETDAFTSTDDIFTTWRETRAYGSPGGSGDAGIDIRWGPRGAYALDATDGGLLDSEILITATDGDVEYFIGTQLDREVGGGGGGILNTAANVDFRLRDRNGNDTNIALYFPKVNPGPDDWTGTLILKPGDLYWTWNGAWNPATGAQVGDPSTGRIYVCERE